MRWPLHGSESRAPGNSSIGARVAPPSHGTRSVSDGSRPSRPGSLPLEPASRGCQRPRRTRQRINPLARPPHGGRVTPARAGSTWQRHRPGRERSCHSRLRGLHHSRRATPDIGSGSLPLARALRPPPKASWSAPGHSCSRGLHSTAMSGTTWTGGSPPLARALHQYVRLPERWNRVNPARRLRAIHDNLRIPADGSLPLARALHHEDRQDHRARRVTPARAGPTRYGPHPGRSASVHSRSRGLYPL